LIDVPNSLRAKAIGEFDALVMRREIDKRAAFVNECKLDQHAHTLVETAARLEQESAINNCTANPSDLDRLDKAAVDLRQRSAQMGRLHHGELCDAFLDATRLARTTTPDALAKEIELITQLSLAIRGLVGLGEEGSNVAQDIAASITERDFDPQNRSRTIARLAGSGPTR
jgi:hypothetical protein